MSMAARAFIERLDCARQTGSGRWIARCPAHEDRSPSLSVRELEDGRTLIHCFGGCDVQAVVEGLDVLESRFRELMERGGRNICQSLRRDQA